jgi:hypothetical protein
MSGHSVFGVSIAATALSERADDPALQRALHEELLEDLAVHGRLYFASEQDMEFFMQAVRALPTSLAKAWEAVLSSRRIQADVIDPSRLALENVLEPAELESQMAPTVALVLVERDQAELLGVPVDEFSARTPGGLIEMARISTAGRTATVLTARQALDAPLREGGNREEEWSQRFGPLVEAASPVVIYDRYVGQHIARRYVHDLPHGDGLSWFLERVSMTPGRKVRVITAVTDERTKNGARFDEQVMALGFGRLMERLGRDLRLELVLVPDRVKDNGKVERFGHDRHLRFGHRAVLALGTGLQAFTKVRFQETITVARLPVSDAKAREERAIKAALRPPRGGWLGWLRD